MSSARRKGKQCRGCKRTKSLDCFGLDRRERDGRNAVCVQCLRILRAKVYRELKML